IVDGGNDARWAVEGDLLVGRAGTARLTGSYDDFHLWAEVQINGEGDAGIVVRAGDGADSGCEVQLTGRATGAPNGSLSVRGPGPGPVVPAKRLGRAGDWLVVEVIARGDLVVSRVNGRPAAQRLVDASGPRRGAVALRAGHPGTEVRFRQIRIQP